MVDKSKNSPEGQAALSMFESLLLAMCDLEVMSEADIRKLLVEAASMHHEASRGSDNPGLHEDAAKLIEHMIASQSTTRGFW